MCKTQWDNAYIVRVGVGGRSVGVPSFGNRLTPPPSLPSPSQEAGPSDLCFVFDWTSATNPNSWAKNSSSSGAAATAIVAAAGLLAASLTAWLV